MKTIGQKIRELRNEYNLTGDDLGKKIGVSRNAISNWENDRRTPDHISIVKLAEIFNTTTDYLLGNSDIRDPYNNKAIIKKDEKDTVPEEFINADEARAYVNKHQIFGSSGFDSNKLDDDKILEFANALLEQMKMVSYKYRK